MYTILIWVAQLVIDLLRAKNNDLSKQVQDHLYAHYKFEKELMTLKEQSALYEESIKAIQSKNEELLERIRLAKIVLGQLKADALQKQEEVIPVIEADRDKYLRTDLWRE